MLLLVVPLAVTSTAYALFSQQLSIDATANSPGYTATQNLSLSYDKTVSQEGQGYTYRINPMSVKNNGTGTIDSWQVIFDVPADASQLNCTDANCTQDGQTVTVTNTITNGTIDGGNTATFSLQFKSSQSSYVLQNINVSGTLAPVFEAMPGLTVSANAGSMTQSGPWYDRPYTITVTNDSGNAITGWRIQAPWSTSTNRVVSMPGTVNYIEATSQLTILSKSGIADGATFQFTPTLGSTNAGWTLTGYTVEGSQ